MLSVLVCAGGWVNSLEAAQFDYNLGYRAEHSDNITRVPDEREGRTELINTVNAGVSYLENNSTVSARIVADVAYNDYYHQTYENQTTLNLDAYGEAFLVQRTLSWVAADSFRRLQINPLLPDTPTNRQNSNAWATGPTANLRFGAVDTVSFEGRYGKAWVQNLDIDNDRYSYAARWAHRVSARSTLSLNYEFLNVDYKNDTLNSDLTRQNYYLRADVRDAITQFIFNAGRTSVEQAGSEEAGDLLIHLTLTQQIASNSVAGIGYRREYSETGVELLSNATPLEPAVGAGAPAMGADVVTSEPFYLESADLFYAHRGSVLPWTARLFYRDIDYLVSPLDRKEKGVQVDMRYVYSSSTYFQVFGNYSVLTFDQPSREDRESSVGLLLAYRMTPVLRAGMEVRRFVRGSTSPNQGYTEDRVALTLMYGSRPAAP